MDNGKRRSVEWPALQLRITSQEQACAVVCFAVQHLLFAKGQIEQPIAVLRKRRTQEKRRDLPIVEDEQDEQLRFRRKPTKSFAARRSERRLDETLRDVDRLQERLVGALDAISSNAAACSSVSIDSVTFLLRLGQAPGGAFTKQQYAIRLQGVLSLPRTAAQADEDERKTQKHALNNISTSRAVFGEKTNADMAATTSSASRLPAMERKLVRFLLSMSMSDEDEAGLGRALAARLGPTRSQVFLLAPQNLEAPGWTPRRSLKVDMDDCITDTSDARGSQLQEAETASDPLQDATDEQNTADDGSAGDVDELAQALSPLKRRRIRSPVKGITKAATHCGTTWDTNVCATPIRASRRAPAPQTSPQSLLRREGDALFEHTNQCAVIDALEADRVNMLPSTSSDAAMDAKRLARSQARSVPVRKSRLTVPQRTRTRNGTLSAGFVIDCAASKAIARAGAESDEVGQWFSSNVVFQARR